MKLLEANKSAFVLGTIGFQPVFIQKSIQPELGVVMFHQAGLPRTPWGSCFYGHDAGT